MAFRLAQDTAYHLSLTHAACYLCMRWPARTACNITQDPWPPETLHIPVMMSVERATLGIASRARATNASYASLL